MSNDNFPQNDEILILINNIKKYNCFDSLKKIQSLSEGLIFRIYRKYSSALKQCGYDSESFEGEKDSVIYDSIISFDEAKGVKFTSWLCENTKYFCLNKLNACNKQKLVYEDVETIDHLIDTNGQHEEPNKEFIEYVNFILDKVSDTRIKDVFHHRYFCGKKTTWKNIAKILGLSSQTCINLHDRGIDILKKKVSSNDTFDDI
jgi:hypothetical protein